MFIKIENDFLEAQINDFGAELHSLVSKETGKEYIWCGEKNIWSGQSPILFPSIGKMLDNSYMLNGKKYEMSKHGFARNNKFEVARHEKNLAEFILIENDDTLRMYPYSFELVITFELVEKSLNVTHTVRNKNNTIMYFSLGGHPAFNIEIGNKVVFDSKETLNTLKVDTDGIIYKIGERILDNSTEIEITNDIFDEDALIFQSPSSKGAVLKSDDQDILHFNWGDAPYLGIWAKPGAPYVCIEPWYGICDSYEKKNDLSEKTGIQSLDVNGEFSYTWSVEIL